MTYNITFLRIGKYSKYFFQNGYLMYGADYLTKLYRFLITVIPYNY
jgi:hypothetical protein